MLAERRLVLTSLQMHESFDRSELSNFYFPDVAKAIREFKRDYSNCFKEAIIIQKCNSVELMGVAPSEYGLRFIKEQIISFWKKTCYKFKIGYLDKFVFLQDEEAVKHFIETLCGLNSVVIGDNQVRGQINNSLEIAEKENAVGPILRMLFKQSNKVDNVILEKTKLHEGDICAERIAVDLLRDKLKDCSVTVGIIGIGNSGKLLAKIMKENGFSKVVLFNRTFDTAQETAKKYGFEAREWGSLPKEISKMTAVLCSAEVSQPVISAEDINTSQIKIIVDIGNPPNVENQVNCTTELVTIDDILKKGEKVKKDRMDEANKARIIIGEELPKVVKSLSTLQMDLVIRSSTFKLDLNDPKKRAIFELRTILIDQFRQFLNCKGFLEVQTPYVTSMFTDPTVESNLVQAPTFESNRAQAFVVNWFGKEAFLRQSPQLSKQALVLSGIEKVWEIGPSWRIEKEPETTNLVEVTTVDTEMRDVNSVEDLMNLTEHMFQSVISAFKRKGAPFLALHKAKINSVRVPIKKLSYLEVLDYLRSKGIKIKTGDELSTAHEKIICEQFDKERWLFIYGFPSSITKFYVKTNSDGMSTYFRLYLDGWKVASGSIREVRLEEIKNKMLNQGLRVSDYDFYLNMFGEALMPNYGGFSVGIDRLLARLLNMEDVRSVVLFPRTLSQI